MNDIKDSVERIEILSVDILDIYRTQVDEFQVLSKQLQTPLGWHYLLDLPWAANQLPVISGTTILDAGAGHGLTQWWLAEKGVNVISVDRSDRSNLPVKFINAHQVQGLRPQDFNTDRQRLRINDILFSINIKKWPAQFTQMIRKIKNIQQMSAPIDSSKGTVFLYNQNLNEMQKDIETASVDAIVSISALEHNTPDGLRVVVDELMRVLKPGGKLIATLGAGKNEDWYHEPSKGWCYTEQTLREIFQLSPSCPSNYDLHDELFESLRNCEELRDNIDEVYTKSGNNGMPWGIWDPQYQPVGVVKVKAEQ